jgi:hypothetical protein
MTRLIYTLPDGSVYVTQPGEQRPGEPEAVWLDRTDRRCRKWMPPGATLVAVVSVSDLPPSHEHRDAWVWDGTKVVVDPARIRPPAERAPQHRTAPADAGIGHLRQELTQIMAEGFTAISQELKAWQYRTQLVANALKRDEEVTTVEARQTREEARAILAEIGARQGQTWQDVAEAIAADRNAELRQLVLP